MFDDNIGRPDSGRGAHIVDVRDLSTGQAVPFDTALARHIVRAEPFLAIEDPGLGGFGTPPAAGAGAGAPAATSGQNFFLLEVLRRLAPERVVSLVEKSDGGGFSSAPEP